MTMMIAKAMTASKIGSVICLSSCRVSMKPWLLDKSSRDKWGLPPLEIVLALPGDGRIMRKNYLENYLPLTPLFVKVILPKVAPCLAFAEVPENPSDPTPVS